MNALAAWLFDWFILTPALLIDYLLLLFVGVAGLLPPMMAWHYTVKIVESDLTSRRVVSWPIAAVVAGYVMGVLLTAIDELPRLIPALL
jgi:hypothetical protein